MILGRGHLDILSEIASASLFHARDNDYVIDIRLEGNLPREVMLKWRMCLLGYHNLRITEDAEAC
jgi:hypothetical protein